SLPAGLAMSRSIAIKNFFLILAGASLFITLAAKTIPYSLARNTTASIPLGLYQGEKLKATLAAAGDLVCFEYVAALWAEDRNYFPDRFPLCKYLTGLQTEVVSKVGDVWVVKAADGTVRLIGELAANDSKGRPLPQDVLSEGTIPQGHY